MNNSINSNNTYNSAYIEASLGNNSLRQSVSNSLHPQVNLAYCTTVNPESYPDGFELKLTLYINGNLNSYKLANCTLRYILIPSFGM